VTSNAQPLILPWGHLSQKCNKNYAFMTCSHTSTIFLHGGISWGSGRKRSNRKTSTQMVAFSMWYCSFCVCAVFIILFVFVFVCVCVVFAFFCVVCHCACACVLCLHRVCVSRWEHIEQILLPGLIMLQETPKKSLGRDCRGNNEWDRVE